MPKVHLTMCMEKEMLVRNEFRIEFDLPCATAMMGLLNLHPSLSDRVVRGDLLRVTHVANEASVDLPVSRFWDCFGNMCTRFNTPAGHLVLENSSVVLAQAEFEFLPAGAEQSPVSDLPDEVLPYLLASRYCEVDRMAGIANDLFGGMVAGAERALAIRDWVHNHVRFDYKKARSTKTALDVFTEREGVCRDFQHLAVTLSRAMNLPARYVTGYLGDIRIPYGGAGDFSAWYQVYLDGRWWDMDARHNDSRLGRLLMAAGRDATDVAITTSFGQANLTHFSVESFEVTEAGTKVPLPLAVAA